MTRTNRLTMLVLGASLGGALLGATPALAEEKATTSWPGTKVGEPLAKAKGVPADLARNLANFDDLDFRVYTGLPEEELLEHDALLVPVADVASPDGRDGSLTLHADAALYAAVLSGGATADLPVASGRHAWVQVVRGLVRVNGQDLSAGDGAALSEEAAVHLQGLTACELLVFDLA